MAKLKLVIDYCIDSTEADPPDRECVVCHQMRSNYLFWVGKNLNICGHCMQQSAARTAFAANYLDQHSLLAASTILKNLERECRKSAH